MSSRRDAFDGFVLDAAARLEATCGEAFPHVEFAVEDVPRGPAPWPGSVTSTCEPRCGCSGRGAIQGITQLTARGHPELRKQPVQV